MLVLRLAAVSMSTMTSTATSSTTYVVRGAGATLRRVFAALAVWAAQPHKLRGSLPPLPRPSGPPKAGRWVLATSLTSTISRIGRVKSQPTPQPTQRCRMRLGNYYANSPKSR